MQVGTGDGAGCRLALWCSLHEKVLTAAAAHGRSVGSMRMQAPTSGQADGEPVSLYRRRSAIVACSLTDWSQLWLTRGADPAGDDAMQAISLERSQALDCLMPCSSEIENTHHDRREGSPIRGADAATPTCTPSALQVHA